VNINQGLFVLVNETTGKVCYTSSYSGRMIVPRSTCYRLRRRMSQKFPECKYKVYKLVRLGGLNE